MGGSGFMSQAQASLKNNRRKKKRLFDTLEHYAEQLQSIREQILKEKKESFIKTTFYTIVLAIILFILFKFAPV